MEAAGSHVARRPRTTTTTSPSPTAKCARTCSPPNTNSYRKDWTNLTDGPAGLIADHVLAHDVADYLRFQAVCRPWRQCCTEPRAYGSLDRRFHPRRWVLLREPFAPPDPWRFPDTSTDKCILMDLPPRRQRFLNISTGECIQVDLPELRDQEVFAVTGEGLLVLHNNCNHVRLLNPLTRHLTPLPPLTTLVPSKLDVYLPSEGCRFNVMFPEWASGILNDDSTVVLSLKSHNIIGLAKPGDVCWTLLTFDGVRGMASSMFAGHFYCVTRDGVKVLADHPPRLELAARLPTMPISSMDSLHLVDCAGELTLVHRRFLRRDGWNIVDKRRYDAYQVDLDAGALCRVNNFGDGRHALFIGMSCCLSVPIEVFPSGSIRGDTIYLSFDIDERKETEGYNVANRREIRSCNLDVRLMAQPHTLVDCLSPCCTGRLWE